MYAIEISMSIILDLKEAKRSQNPAIKIMDE